MISRDFLFLIQVSCPVQKLNLIPWKSSGPVMAKSMQVSVSSSHEVISHHEIALSRHGERGSCPNRDAALVLLASYPCFHYKPQIANRHLWKEKHMRPSFSPRKVSSISKGYQRLGMKHGRPIIHCWKKMEHLFGTVTVVAR